jgi:hypothetical protein
MRVTSNGHGVGYEFSDSEYRQIEHFAALEGQSVEQWLGEIIKAKFQQVKALNDREPAPVVDLRSRLRSVGGTGKSS